MNKLLFVGLIIFTSTAQAFNDRATVIDVKVAYSDIQTPYQECTTELVRYNGGGPLNGGALLGGLAGGALGSTVGKGDGRRASTVVGAIVGYNVGQDRGGYREVQNCRTLYKNQVVESGYIVTYNYRGEVGTVRMQYHPGNTIDVRVQVTPIGSGY